MTSGKDVTRQTLRHDGTTLASVDRTFSVHREPTFALPLRWGGYWGRYLAGIALLFAGAICIQSATTYVPLFLFAGIAAFFTGWIVLPARGVRRVLVILPSFLAVVLLLTGPESVAVLVVPFIAWLIVRQRPLVSYLTAIPVLGVGLVLALMYHEWKDMPLTLGVMTGVFVACAWLAFWVTGTRQTPSQRRGRSQ